MNAETKRGILDQPISRRDALKIIGLTAVVAACSPGKLTPEHASNPEEPIENKKLKQYIKELPDSELNSGLKSRILQLYKAPTPESIEIGGLDVPISSATITQDVHNSSHFTGSARLDSDDFDSPGLAKSDTSYFAPLPYYLKDSEKAKFNPNSLTQSGALKLTGEILEGESISDAISPKIKIVLPDRNKYEIDPLHYEEMEKAVYIKEAFAIDFMLEYYARIAKEMNTIGQSPMITTQNGKEVNSLIGLFNSLQRRNGRFLAIIDLASYYLALKTFMNTDTEIHLRQDPNINNAYYSIESYLEETKIEDQFEQSIDWALNSPAAKDLVHEGNIDDFIH